MTNVRLFVFVIITAVWYLTPIGTATTDSEDLPKSLEEWMIEGPGPRGLTDVRTGRIEEGGPRRPCQNGPCAFSIYKPPSRKIVNFLRRPCDCPENQVCRRTDHDSYRENAFYHGCRPKDDTKGDTEEYDYYQ